MIHVPIMYFEKWWEDWGISLMLFTVLSTFKVYIYTSVYGFLCGFFLFLSEKISYALM